jgi:hypothetical protein
LGKGQNVENQNVESQKEHQKFEKDQNVKSQIRLSTFWSFLTPKVLVHFLAKNTFDVLILLMSSKKIRMSKVIFWLSTFFLTFWFLMFWSFDVLIFWHSDHPKNTFDVLTLRCSDFWCSDPLPQLRAYILNGNWKARNKSLKQFK